MTPSLNSLIMDLPKSGQSYRQPYVSVIKHQQQKMITSKLNLDSAHKMVLCKYMIAELELYNAMVTQFTSAVSRTPDIFSYLTNDHISLFGELCLHGLSVDAAKNNKNFETKLEILKSIPESIKIIFEIAKTKFNVLSNTKRNIAKEMLAFFVENSEQFRTKNKFGFQTLSKCDIYQKRHIQVLKGDCKIVYDKVKNQSVVYIPHMVSPLCVVNGKNMVNEHWEILIVHQKPNTVPTATTDWIAEFRPSRFDYILRYMDKKN